MTETHHVPCATPFWAAVHVNAKPKLLNDSEYDLTEGQSPVEQNPQLKSKVTMMDICALDVEGTTRFAFQSGSTW